MNRVYYLLEKIRETLRKLIIEDHIDSKNNLHESENCNQGRKENRITSSLPATPNQNNTKKPETTPNNRPKPPLAVRFWRALWRKRIFFHGRMRHANWAEITGIAIAFGILLATWVQVYIYSQQAGFMHQALDQNGAQLAVAARNQRIGEEQFMKTFKQLTEQTGAQVNAGNAAKSAANIADKTLHVSQRAYLAAVNFQIDYSKSIINFQILNSGHIPAENVQAILYEATFNPPQITEEVPTSFEYIVERNKGIVNLGSLAPTLNNPNISEGIPAKVMSKERLENGTQMIIIVGEIFYNDGCGEAVKTKTTRVERTIVKGKF